MASIRITPDQKDYLRVLYLKFGENSFQWIEAKEFISKGLFRVFCDNGFIIKNGEVYRKTTTGKYNTQITQWKFDMDCVKRYMQ